MNTCSAELIALIFDHACSDDFGQTARRLGLVSKYFRAIAEPIEFRALAVSGFRQLQGAVARLLREESLEVSRGAAQRGVRHLLISELTKEHALVVDTDFKNGSRGTRSSFWMTEEGKLAEAFYDEHTDEFWKLVAELIRVTSFNLETLFLLSSANFYSWRGSRFKKATQSKVLGVLSGVVLPKLVSLTLNHNASSEIQCFRNGDVTFQPPVIASLRRLHIVSTVYVDRRFGNHDDPENVHPLLPCLLSQNHKLEQLTLCDARIASFEIMMRLIFGQDWRARLAHRTLPGMLRSVSLQQGMVPTFGCGTGYVNYCRAASDFVRNVTNLHVAGLEAQFPSKMYPEPGKREYELLSAEFKGQCIAGTA